MIRRTQELVSLAAILADLEPTPLDETQEMEPLRFRGDLKFGPFDDPSCKRIRDDGRVCGGVDAHTFGCPSNDLYEEQR